MEDIKELLFSLFVVKNYIEIKLENNVDNTLNSIYKNVMSSITEIENKIKYYLKNNNIVLDNNIILDEQIKKIRFEKSIENIKLENIFTRIELEEELNKLKEKYNGR
ncbi:MAG TPA: hypothetical protein PKW55_06060 [Spirochaetota bacterium]|nr:hypothetical protein [Spirochaetota bacterium]HOM38447.1 hypothetical protein [Spirochaetota bacterium]HPQ48987.1 hypothetical protein [Spirochaetota bacterium]